MSFPDDPNFDISGIAGNASDSTKRILGNTSAFFGNRDPTRFKNPILGEAIFQRMKVVEVSTSKKENEPRKLEGKVVIELTVEDDMLNIIGHMHGGCAAFLIDMASTFSMQALIAANTGQVVNNVSQTINVIYHSPAERRDLLRLVNTSLTVGARVHSARTEIWDATRHRLVASGTHVKMSPAEPTPKGKL